MNKNDIGQNELNTSNRGNHRYFESKSTKKDKNFNEIYNDFSRKKNNYKDIKANNYGNVNNKEKNEKYFYSYCNIYNNNYMTDKKNGRVRTSQYYQ